MQVHPHEKTKRKDFIHTTIDKLNEARRWTCMVWSPLHGYFKDSLTLCYKIQSTKIAKICITAFLIWLSCFLISHQWDWAWCRGNRVWYFWLFCSPRPHISFPVWKKDTLNTNFQKTKLWIPAHGFVKDSRAQWMSYVIFPVTKVFCFLKIGVKRVFFSDRERNMPARRAK